MWLCIAPDKAFENVFCIKAILRLPTKNRFYEFKLSALSNRVQDHDIAQKSMRI